MSPLSNQIWFREIKVLKRLDAPKPRQLDTPTFPANRQPTTPHSSTTTSTTITNNTAESLSIPPLQHHRIRALHGDHQPLYIAPPPAHFLASPAPPSLEKPFQLKAPALVRSVSAIELPTRTPEITTDQPQPHPAPIPTSSIPVTPTPTNVPPQPKKRGRKPKDPIAHAAKKEAKEKRRLEREAAIAALRIDAHQMPCLQEKAPGFPHSTVMYVAQAGMMASNVVAAKKEVESNNTSRPSTSSANEIGMSSRPTSRPSSSGVGAIAGMDAALESSASSQSGQESKKRSADSAFSLPQDLTTTWLSGSSEAAMELETSWPISTPIGSPITSPQTGGLGIFIQAPPSTPIDELLSSSAQLGINPALLFHEETLIPVNERVLAKAAQALKSPLEILDEYPLPQMPATDASSSNRSDTPEDSGKKLGLMDLMLLRQPKDNEDKPSPRKKSRPDLVFSTTKRGKAIVSLQKNASIATEQSEPTTPIRETRPVEESETDLRSLVLKRRKELLGDEVGTEVTRISVHRRLTARQTSVGLMSPLSPKSTAKHEEQKQKIIDSDSDSSDSSDSEDESNDPAPTHQMNTPLATPTNPLVAGQSMQRSFSAPGIFHPASLAENTFLSSAPHNEEESYPLLATRSEHPSFDADSGMRCKTCWMLFRKQAELISHERTCMVKQTPFIPYDFLRADHADDGFAFGGGRQLFSDDILLTCESPLVHKGEATHKRVFSSGFVAPLETVSSEEEEEEEAMGHKFRPAQAERTEKKTKSQTRCICGKGEKAVSGVMVQWYNPFSKSI